MKKILGGLGVMMMLAGCGSSPEPDYYVLQPVNGTEAPTVTQTLKFYRPELPSYLDRPDRVSQSGDRIDIDEERRWAAPLDEMLGDVLAADLHQRMPNAVIMTEHDSMAASPRYTLDIEVQNFNADSSGTVMVAHMFLKDSCFSPPASPVPVTFRATAGSGTEGLSALAGQLADAITSKLAEEPSTARPCTNQTGARKPQ